MAVASAAAFNSYAALPRQSMSVATAAASASVPWIAHAAGAPRPVMRAKP
ncbi:MAG: hypothetical protein P4L72_00065 [Parvibaculum sp.]|nr:hypothetical protein [Parvibaculum sp.]MDR3497600.1 hypothetical protein [Parvibaculum sp.]